MEGVEVDQLSLNQELEEEEEEEEEKVEVLERAGAYLILQHMRKVAVCLRQSSNSQEKVVTEFINIIFLKLANCQLIAPFDRCNI